MTCQRGLHSMSRLPDRREALGPIYDHAIIVWDRPGVELSTAVCLPASLPFATPVARPSYPDGPRDEYGAPDCAQGVAGSKLRIKSSQRHWRRLVKRRCLCTRYLQCRLSYIQVSVFLLR